MAEKSSSADRFAELELLASAVRRINQLTLLGIYSKQETAELAAEAKALSDKLESLNAGGTPEIYRSPPKKEGLDNILPFDAISGKYNPLSIPIAFEWEPPIARGYVNFSELHMGPPRCVHGGFISAYFDQIMTVANAMNKKFCPTARLTTKYRKPTPINQDLVFEAWVDSVEGSKVNTRAKLYHGDTLTAEAQGLFIHLTREELNSLIPES